MFLLNQNNTEIQKILSTNKKGYILSKQKFGHHTSHNEDTHPSPTPYSISYWKIRHWGWHCATRYIKYTRTLAKWVLSKAYRFNTKHIKTFIIDTHNLVYILWTIYYNPKGKTLSFRMKCQVHLGEYMYILKILKWNKYEVSRGFHIHRRADTDFLPAWYPLTSQN